MSTENPTRTDLGWPDLSELKKGAFRVLGEVLDEDSDHTVRDRLQAASMVKSMEDSNIKVEEFKDKTARLDAGTPTEITDSKTLGEAAMSLAAQLEDITKPRKVVEIVEPEQIEASDDDLRPD